MHATLDPGSPKPARLSAAPAPASARLLTLRELQEDLPDWRALARNTLEPNIHLEPEFLLAHLAHLNDARDIQFLCVFAGIPEKLAGLFALKPRGRSFTPGFARGWKSKFASLGVPLVDASQAAAVIDAFLDALADQPGAKAGLLLPFIPLAGPFAALLAERLAARGAALTVASAHERAVFKPGSGANALPAKHAREWRRLEKKLAAQGPVKLASAESPAEIRAAVERFLVIETRGWKLRAGTTLLQDPGRAAFLRALARGLAPEGRIRIDELFAGERLAASAITLISPPHAYYWKIAYDEALSPASPGLQLTYHTARRFDESADLSRIDSCAIPGNSLMRLAWRETMRIGDIVIPGPGAFAFKAAMKRETGWQNFRNAAKRAVYRVNGKKWS